MFGRRLSTMRRRGRLRRTLAVGAGALAMTLAAASAWAESVTLVDVGRFQFADEDGAASEFSGITWVEGDRYLAVSDAHSRLYPLHITLDRHTGVIRAVRIEPAIALRSGLGEPLRRTDLEGIAYDRHTGTVLTADELGPTVREHDPATGDLRRHVGPSSHEPLRTFARVRLNLGWESLTLTPDGRHVWTANEESLRNDGPRATPDAGTLVRLQRLDRDLRPAGQWAYRTDPLPDRITFPRRFAHRASAGLSELLALDDGRLLALERHFGGTDAGLAHYRIRIYELDFTGATETTDVEHFFNAGDSVTPVGKRLVWETISYAPIDNFEGMTLGPELANGDRALILIADNNGGRIHAFHALRLVRPPTD